MDLKTNNMPKFIYYTSILVVLFIIYTIAHAHYEVWLRAEPIHLIGEKTNNLTLLEIKKLYKHYSIYEHLKAIIVSIGISLSTTLVIVYYKNKVIKALFVLLDGAIMYLFLGFDYAFWWKWGSVIYGCYITLIVYFVGSIASEFVNQLSLQPKEEKISKSEVLEAQIKDLQYSVKTQEHTFGIINSNIEKYASLFKRQQDIVDIDRKIAARKQKLRRENKDWKNDPEILVLIEEKEKI